VCEIGAVQVVLQSSLEWFTCLGVLYKNTGIGRTIYATPDHVTLRLFSNRGALRAVVEQPNDLPYTVPKRAG
jgi:hypothetical protein